ncbi:hypothetical protein [Mycolicibacterium mageritense]|uniref:hypothetical protein n=1 Tax=Mycolicibacterium mageritense TaxID=53462 RepID=UPI0011D9489E|nr:hypothetical protein [Mycolicibacterium mageritense]TXI65306.1 MAG: hypothetical protein E6Q55_02545 [Mycolicibacterium mageritense]
MASTNSPPGALAFAEFSEAATHPNPAIAADAAIELIQRRSNFGDGLPFTQREADIYRELYHLAAPTGSGSASCRVGLIVAIAIGTGAALWPRATQQTSRGCRYRRDTNCFAATRFVSLNV